MSLTIYRSDGIKKAAQRQLVGDAPAGVIAAYAGSAIPTDWLPCDGRAVGRTAYPDLFNAIGTTWGTGDGSTTFNIPNLQNRMLYGSGSRALGVLSQTDPAQANPGEETHTLSGAESGTPVHGHASTLAAPAHTHSTANQVFTNAAAGGVYLLGSPGVSQGAVQTVATGAASATALTGSITNAVAAPASNSHNNMPPYGIVNWIIRAIPPYKTANIQLASTVQRVTSLPTYPVDGQEIYYVADATNGVMWHLRYNAASASAYKWEFLGGGTLTTIVQGSGQRAFGTWGDLSDVVGPAVAIPLAGDYDLDWGFEYGYQTGQAGALILMGIDGCGDTAANRWTTFNSAAGQANDTANMGVAPGRVRRRFALSLGTLTAKYFIGGSTGNGIYNLRYIHAQPVRVG